MLSIDGTTVPRPTAVDEDDLPREVVRSGVSDEYELSKDGHATSPSEFVDSTMTSILRSVHFADSLQNYVKTHGGWEVVMSTIEADDEELVAKYADIFLEKCNTGFRTLWEEKGNKFQARMGIRVADQAA